MAFRLPRLPRGPIVSPKSGDPVQMFTVYWQRFAEAIEAQEEAQDATINRMRRLMSHTAPTTILSAHDDGSSCTVTVLDHVRIYADATSLSITGGSYPGLANDTWYACYYDDVTLQETAPDFVFTTDANEAQAAFADGRHFCGLIKTPVAGTGQTIESGGAYPVGSAAVAGEMIL